MPMFWGREAIVRVWYAWNGEQEKKEVGQDVARRQRWAREVKLVEDILTGGGNSAGRSGNLSTKVPALGDPDVVGT